MKRMSALILLSLVSVLGMHTLAGSKAQAPQLVAIKFHADWCGSCQKMGDSFTHLQNKFDGENILFVTLDKTDRSKKQQGELLMSTMELDNVWNDNSGTGFILLLDGKTKKVVAKLTAADNFKAMAAKVKAQLKS